MRLCINKYMVTKGAKWFNNGVKNVRKIECPIGFVPGRIKFSRASPTEETRAKMSESAKGQIPWNSGMINPYSEETRKKMSISAKARVARGILPDNTGNIGWNRSSNMPEFQRYKNDVRISSDRNYRKYKHIINPDNHTRGKFDYHLDHIIPILHAFENNMTVEEASDIKNLQMLPWKENLSKGCKLAESK